MTNTITDQMQNEYYEPITRQNEPIEDKEEEREES
jgi:hypothetical protein